MIEYLDYPNEIFNFFRLGINYPYTSHPYTKGWIKEVLEQDEIYHREIILQRGKADFNTNFNSLMPDEKVTLYCNYYMQMHIVSGYHVFLQCKSILNKYLANNNKIVFIDFGCGSLTSGVALSWYYLVSQQHLLYRQKLNFNYLGIDSSKSMLNKAKGTSQYSELFEIDKCYFQFLATIFDYESIYLFVNKHLTNEQNLILLNFSYFFASDTLNVEYLYSLINKIIEVYGNDNEIVIAFQNPDNPQLNYKWNIFKENISMYSYTSASETLIYRNTTTSYNKDGFY